MTKSVTLRLDDEKINFLDRLASTMDRDRIHLLNEAVDNDLDVKKWQIRETEKAIREADAGAFAAPEDAEAFFRMARERL